MYTFFGKNRRATEAEIEETYDAVKKQIVQTVYEAEQKYRVSRSTICRLLKGSSQPSRQGHERQQLLTEKEEESLML
jgi:hypothetical protein